MGEFRVYLDAPVRSPVLRSLPVFAETRSRPKSVWYSRIQAGLMSAALTLNLFYLVQSSTNPATLFADLIANWKPFCGKALVYLPLPIDSEGLQHVPGTFKSSRASGTLELLAVGLGERSLYSELSVCQPRSGCTGKWSKAALSSRSRDVAWAFPLGSQGEYVQGVPFTSWGHTADPARRRPRSLCTVQTTFDGGCWCRSVLQGSQLEV